MKKNVFLVIAACGGMLLSANNANAQETIFVEEDLTITETVPCKDYYYSTWKDNWYLQMGAGINVPFLENNLINGDAKHHFTAAYNLGFGKWMSPYLGWRISMLYGALHWDNNYYSKAKYANTNFDLMWDMFNSLGGANPGRVFSIVPFVGLGGTFAWDFKAPSSVIMDDDGKPRSNSWSLPVSAGMQLRFRLCKYADFFVEGRAQFYGDNFNNCAYGDPIDVNITAVGGFVINFGGSGFRSYNPCNELSYIGNLNNQINDLRGQLASTYSRLAAAEAQLPCPEVKAPDCPEVPEAAPLMATVRFALNSAKVNSSEMVNIYNVAQWMKENPKTNVVIKGYADKDTGTSEYNMTLSKKRAEAVYNILVNEYGVKASRLMVHPEGSNTQVYGTNNWNRIVIFSQGK